MENKAIKLLKDHALWPDYIERGILNDIITDLCNIDYTCEFYFTRDDIKEMDIENKDAILKSYDSNVFYLGDYGILIPILTVPMLAQMIDYVATYWDLAKDNPSLKKKYEQEVDFYYNKWHKILERWGAFFEYEIEATKSS